MVRRKAVPTGFLILVIAALVTVSNAAHGQPLTSQTVQTEDGSVLSLRGHLDDGACCLGNGTCLVTSEIECVKGEGGLFAGEGTTCDLTARRLYSLERSTGILRILDPYTFDTTGIVPIRLPGRFVDGGTGLACEPGTNRLWAIVETFDANLSEVDRGFSGAIELISIDPLTGFAQRIGNLEDPNGETPDLNSLAFRADGSLYAGSGDGGVDSEFLFQLNTSDAGITPLGPLTDAGGGEALATNTNDNLLYRAGGEVPFRGCEQVFESVDPAIVPPVPTAIGAFFCGDPKAMTYDDMEGDFLLVTNELFGRGNGGFPVLRRLTALGNSTFVTEIDHESKGLAFCEVNLDCNGNGTPDACDIAGGASTDCNANAIPDECEADCNANGTLDECEVSALYALPRHDDTLIILDPTDGSPQRFLSIVLPGRDVDGGKGLALHPQTGELWAILEVEIPFDEQRGGDCEIDVLARINRFTGLATEVGVLRADDFCDLDVRGCRGGGGCDEFFFSGLAFNADGSVLYAVTGEQGNDEESLFTLNQTDASPGFVTSLMEAGSGEALAFNPNDTLLYRAGGSDVAPALGNNTINQVFESIDPANSFSESLIPPFVDPYRTPRAMTWDAGRGAFLLAAEDESQRGSSAVLFSITTGGKVTRINDLFDTLKGLAFAPGSAADCNGNGTPDECEPDCNSNGTPDECDIRNCDGSVGCQDCNNNGVPDECDIADGTAQDCNGNGRPDACDLIGELTATGAKDFGEFFGEGRSEGFYFVNPSTAVESFVGDAMTNLGALKDVAVDPTTGNVYSVEIPYFFLLIDVRSSADQFLYQIDPATGLGTPAPNPLSSDVFSEAALGLTFTADGTLYGIGDGFVSIDPTLGNVTQLINQSTLGYALATSPTDQIFALLFSSKFQLGEGARGGGQNFVIGTLAEIDRNTGEVLSSVDLFDSIGCGVMMDIAFGADGLLYGLRGFLCERGGSFGETDLVTIDPVTGAITHVGELGAVLSGLGGPLPGTASADCNENGTPDECDADCNSNGTPDDCDIAVGASTDCNSNGTPDECDAALVLGGCPPNVTVQAADAGGIAVEYPTPPTQNGCNVMVTVIPPSGTVFPVGTTSVMVTASDELGQIASCTFTVTVLPPDEPAPGGGGDTGGAGQGLPGGLGCLFFLFQSLFGFPLCGPCLVVSMIASFAGIIGMKARYRRRRRAGR